jgi:hypothetical protein
MGLFQPTVFQPTVFQMDAVEAEEAVAVTQSGAGGALAWIKRYGEKDAEDRRKADLLALIRSSDEYKRLQRKLRMLHEHLLDDPRSWKIKDGIAAIEAQIEMMERL